MHDPSITALLMIWSCQEIKGMCRISIAGGYRSGISPQLSLEKHSDDMGSVDGHLGGLISVFPDLL